MYYTQSHAYPIGSSHERNSPVTRAFRAELSDGLTFREALVRIAQEERAAGCKEAQSSVEREQNNNPCANKFNGFVWPLWEATKAEYDPRIGAPYCASFVSYAVEQAARLAGCSRVNMIVTASVQGLGVWAEANNVLKGKDYTPEPGDILLRNRWQNGTRTPDGTTWRRDGRGHCAIITRVLAGSILTTEANGLYSARGGQDAVHEQNYSFTELQNDAQGFAFIPATALADCPVSGSTQTGGATQGGGADMVRKSDDPSNTTSRKPQRTGGTTECPPRMTEVQLDGLGDAALHYENLRNPLVASDVFGANNTELVAGGNWAKRNGAALGFRDIEFANDSSRFTGFGVCTDKAGNTILITVDDGTNQNSARVIEKLLDKSICSRIQINFIPGSAPKLVKYAQSLMGEREVLWSQDNYERGAVNNQDSNDLRLLTIGGASIYDGLWQYAEERWTNDNKKLRVLPLMKKDATGLLRAIETLCLNRSKKLDKVIWLHYAAEPPASNWLDVLSTVLSTLTAFAPGLGIAKEVWAGAAQGIKGIKSGNIMDSIQGISAVVGAISPETLRNVEKLTEDAKAVIKRVEQEIKTVGWNIEASYEQLISPTIRAAGSVLAGIENTMQIQQVAKSLGIDAAELHALRQRFRTINPTQFYTPDFVNRISGKYGDYAPLIQTLNTSVMVDSLRTQLRSIGGSDSNISWLKQQLLGVYGGRVEQVPILQELFSTGMAGTLLPSVPGFSDIVASILTDASARTNALGDVASTAFSHKLKNWLGGAFGYKMGENILADLTLRSLTEQANQYAYNRLKDFPLPLAIPEKYRATFAQEIAQAMQGDVRVHCSDGQVFDLATCRCVSSSSSTTEPGKQYPKEFPNSGSDPVSSPTQSGGDTPVSTGEPSSRRDCCPTTQTVTVNNYIVSPKDEKKGTEQDNKIQKVRAEEAAATIGTACPVGTYRSGQFCVPIPYTALQRSGYEQFCASCTTPNNSPQIVVVPTGVSSAAPQFPSTIKLELPDISKLIAPPVQLPPINITLPNITLPSITLPNITIPAQQQSTAPTAAAADRIQVDVHVPEQKAPVIPAPVVQVQVPEPVVNVHTAAPIINIPEQKPPSVEVHTAAPIVNVPEQKAPILQLQQPAPVVHIEQPAPVINMPLPPTPILNVQMPEPVVNVHTAAPVVNVPKQPAPVVVVQQPEQNVHVQPRVEVRPHIQLQVPEQPAPVVQVEVNTPQTPAPHVEVHPVINIPRQSAPRVNVTPQVEVKPQFTVHVPEQKTPAPVVNIAVPEAPRPVVHVGQPAPVVNVYTPKAPAPVLPAPVINIEAPKIAAPVLPAPVVNVTVPKSEAPTVNVHQAPPVVEVTQPAPVVHVHTPQAPQPVVKAPTVNVHLPEVKAPVLPAQSFSFNPIIQVPERETTVNVPVHLTVPERQQHVSIPITVPQQEQNITIHSPVTVPERQQNITVHTPVTVPERQQPVTVHTPVTVAERPMNLTVPISIPEREQTINVQVPERAVTVSAPVNVPERQVTVNAPTRISMQAPTTNVNVQNTMPPQNNTYYNTVSPTLVQRNYQSNPQTTTQSAEQRSGQHNAQRSEQNAAHQTRQNAAHSTRSFHTPHTYVGQAQVAPQASGYYAGTQGVPRTTEGQGGYYHSSPPTRTPEKRTRGQPTRGQPTRAQQEEDCEEEIELTLTGFR